MSIIFLYKPFVAFCGNPGWSITLVGDVLKFREQEIYLFTSLYENCREFQLRSDRSYYVDLRQISFVSKLKLVKDHVYEIYNNHEAKTEHKEDSKEAAAEQNHRCTVEEI